jgi:hypothetical protein
MFRFCRIALLSVVLCTAARAADDPYEEILSATFRVHDKGSSGSCFLVATSDAPEAAHKVTLVTCGHVFEKMEGKDCKLILRAGKPGETYVRKEITLQIRDKDNNKLWKKHPDVDLAALRVELPPDVAVKPLRLEQILDEAALKDRKLRVAQELWLPGFPAKLEGNPAGWPVLRRATVATHPLVPLKSVKMYMVNSSSLGGDSGAPLFLLGGPAPLLVGVIQGMERQTDKVTSAVEEHTVFTPMGLGIAVQAPFVRDILAQLDK